MATLRLSREQARRIAVSAQRLDAPQPDVQRPDTQRPDVQQPDAQQPDAQRLSAQQPDTQRPDVQQPDTQQPDAPRLSAQQPDVQQPDTQQPDTQRLSAEQLSAQPDAPPPSDLVALVQHLMFLQLDPTAAVAPSADLIAWSRLGTGYRPEQLTQALNDRLLFEITSQDEPKSPAVAMVRPMSDLALFLARMAGPPKYEQTRNWLRDNEPFRRDLLARLRDTGPLLSKEIPDTSVRPWQSTGWTGNRNVTMMLEVLMARGQVAIAGRRGRQRIWDLPERVYPAGLIPVPVEEAAQELDRRRLRSLGIARAATTGDAGVPAQVEGSTVAWRVDPDALDQSFAARTALLSPFDRLVHDRIRLQEIFEYEYILEMYKPAAARRWGYFPLPVLYHDRLVGKLDATADRRRGVLEITAMHADVRLTKPMRAAIDAEIAALAKWLGLEPTGI